MWTKQAHCPCHCILRAHPGGWFINHCNRKLGTVQFLNFPIIHMAFPHYSHASAWGSQKHTWTCSENPFAINQQAQPRMLLHLMAWLERVSHQPRSSMGHGGHINIPVLKLREQRRANNCTECFKKAWKKTPAASVAQFAVLDSSFSKTLVRVRTVLQPSGRSGRRRL
jgi:hypothetical protein